MGRPREGRTGAVVEPAHDRRRRIEQLIDLAQAYCDCTRKELARRLGRDPTKLIPGTGVPKLDVVVELASVLDWPIGDVVEHLWDVAPNGDDDAPSGRRARAMLRDSRELARRGRFIDAAERASAGLREPGATTSLLRALQVQLGEAHYALGALVLARSLARDLIAGERRGGPRSPEERQTSAASHWLAGQAARRMLAIETRRPRQVAAAARTSIERALAAYRHLALERDDPAAEGRARTCTGALIELDVALKRLSATAGITRLAAGLERTRHDIEPHQLEAYGWWCIYGCNIALRHLTDAGEVEHAMAIFTNKADEIAGELDDWALRERVFTMQYTRRSRRGESPRFVPPPVIDADDIRVIAGTMGRFPAFRPIGWRILSTADVVRGPRNEGRGGRER